MRRPGESIQETLSKPNQHATHFARRVGEFSPGRTTHEPEVGRQLDMRGKFVSRAKCNINESSHVSIAVPATSFGDVPGNRDRSPSCLVDQAEPLRSRVPLRRPVNQYGELLALLPDLQLLEVIHASAIRPRGALLNTHEHITAGRPGVRLQTSRARLSADCLLMAAFL